MRAARPLLLVVVAVAIGLALGLFLINRGAGGGETPRRLDVGAIDVSATLNPRMHLFGDPVVAEVVTFFDARDVKPGSLRVASDFEPYSVSGPVVEETRRGDLVRNVHRYTLRCLEQECVPASATRVVNFPSGRVDYTVNAPPPPPGQGTGMPQRSGTVFSWPEVEAVSRTQALDISNPQWRANTRRPPEISYRIRPPVLAALLFGGAAGLLLLAGVLTALALPRRRATLAEEVEEGRISPLERAVALLEATNGNGTDPERRKALGLLARELADADQPELAGRARRLAWSESRPQPADVDSLAGDVRRTALAREDAE